MLAQTIQKVSIYEEQVKEFGWTQAPPVIEELWAEIARVGNPGSRVIFRTAGEKSPVEPALSPETRALFRYDQERARELHAQDRSAIYGMFHIYERVGGQA